MENPVSLSKGSLWPKQVDAALGVCVQQQEAHEHNQMDTLKSLSGTQMHRRSRTNDTLFLLS